MTEKLSEARIKANKKWDSNNRERTRYLNARSGARGFIKNKSTIEDLEELKGLIKQREEELKKDAK